MSFTTASEDEKKERLNVIRRAPKLTGLLLFATAFQTLGIIYSDIGTSPLYVLNGIWPPGGPVPSEEDVIGGVSAIVWSLTLLPLLKYVVICLRFGTSEGEGGTFALFHGLYPPKTHDIESDRTLTGETVVSGKSLKESSIMEKIRWPMLICALFGTSLTMADGVLTPAVSVTSAVAGIAVAKPSVSHDVVPISIAIIVVLFLVQRFGTSRLAFSFAPITFIWLTLLGITGIVNIVKFPGIFRAFDPSRTVLFFKRTRDYDLLGGVLLAITGCEALFANLGQFNAASIQIAFGGFVYPCLILAYLDQGARLVVDGEAVISNVFYLTIPGPQNGVLFWILYVFAILATIIASQAMISATFSLVQQVVNMRSLPPVKMIYTSETIQGQIYVPIVNWILLVATVVVVACFKNSTSLSNAYGFAVATVMIATTTLIAFQIKLVKHESIILAIAFFIFFGFLDGLFWGASYRKVPEGAWVPLMFGCILLALMTFWTWAKGLEDAFDGANRKNLRHFISLAEDENDYLMSQTTTMNGDIADELHTEYTDAHAQAQAAALYYVAHASPKVSFEKDDAASEMVEEKRELVRIESCAIFHKLTPGQGVPHSFIGFVRQWPALPRIVIFLSVRMIPIAHVGLEDRYQVTKVRTIQGFYGVTYCLGFRDDFDVKVEEVISHICQLEKELDPEAHRITIRKIENACQTYTHIVPHYHVVSKEVKAGKLSPVFSWIRALLIEGIYRRMATMFPETANWLSSADDRRIIHVGINATI